MFKNILGNSQQHILNKRYADFSNFYQIWCERLFGKILEGILLERSENFKEVVGKF